MFDGIGIGNSSQNERILKNMGHYSFLCENENINMPVHVIMGGTKIGSQFVNNSESNVIPANIMQIPTKLKINFFCTTPVVLIMSLK
jgi:hypothetical protein